VNFGLLLVMSGSGKVASKMAFHGAAAFGVIALLKLRRWGRKNQETILLNTTGI
jgi:hypothetical protein